MEGLAPRARARRLALLFMLAACGSGGSEPTSSGTAPRFRFESDTLALDVGDTLSPSLVAVGGSLTPDRKSVTWRTEDATIASVSGEGLVAGGRAGTTRITATSGSTTDTMAVLVTLPRAASVRAAIVTGDNQISYRANGTLPEPIVVRLVHARSGRPVPTAGVEWRTTVGAVVSLAATSNDSGVVSARWTLARTAGVHALALRLAGDSATLLQVRATLGIRTLRTSGVPELAWPGDTLRPAFAALDAVGDSLDPGAIALRLPPTGPLREIDGRLVAVSEGRTTIAIEGAGYRDSLSLTIGTLLRGQGTALLADQRVDGAWFYLRSGACVDSAKLETDGRFVLRATRPLHGQVSDQYFDAPTAASRRVLPSARFGTRVDSGAFVRALLFPWDVVIPSGRWSGQRRPFSLFAAMSGGEVSSPYFGQVSLSGWMYGWPSPGLIPVFFDRESPGVQPVTAADSVATWQALRDLEQSIGLPLFQPSEARLHPPTWFRWSSGDSVLARRGAIAVQFRGFDSGGANGRCNGVLIAVIGCPRVIDYEFGTMELRSPRMAGLSALYALGFRNTCMFPSALGGTTDARASDLCNRFRLASADAYAETTPIETAHMHVYFALTRLQRQFPDAWSARETIEGQRVLQLGLPSLASLFGPTARATSVEHDRSMRGSASCG